MSKKLSVISAPFSGGQGKLGVDDGPKHLLNLGLIDVIKDLGWDVAYDGDLSFEVPVSDANIGKVKRPRYVADSTRKVYENVKKAAQEKRFPLTLGGDHSIAIGTVSAVKSVYPDAVLLWIDAHADLNTPSATESGNLHGCPVSFLLGIADKKDTTDPDTKKDVFEWVPHCLKHNELAYIGLRDVDAFEKNYIREQRVAAFSMHHIDRYGIAQVVERALSAVDPDGNRPIHLSFDVDAIDPFFAPSTGTPVRGGLTWREACYLCEAIAETGRLVAMDLVECNPHLGRNDQEVTDTIAAGLSLIKCSLGDTLL